jgi:GTP-binding protein
VKFVDSTQVKVIAGRGGNGSVAFRREKFVPFGGPAGGDGGKGGDILFVTDPGKSTLLDLTHARTLKAKDGQHGMGSDCYGRGGEDLVVRVPVGTQVLAADTGDLLFDLDAPNVTTIVAKGGKGGRGNIHFASSHDRAPRRAEPGDQGEERELRLELKVMADVGLLGFPNVGKSTFVSACSRARPKIADYPFTTLTPHLGVASIGEDAHFVLADIPGLIPGAADGAGLGIRFLKHVERTRALLHLVTLDPGEDRDPVADYEALLKELKRFDPELAKRPTIVAMSKADIPEVQEAYAVAKPRFAKKGIPLHLVSAATGEGVRELLIRLFKLVRGELPEEVEGVADPEPEPTVAKTKKAAPKKKVVAKAKTKKAAPKKKVVAKKAAPKKKKAAPKKKVVAKTKKAAPKKKVVAKKKPATKAKKKTKKK